LNSTGVLVAVLGPDGVGKSTVLEGLAAEFIVPLRRRRLFHYRPQVLAKRKDNRPVTDPHGQTPRGALISMVYLSVFFADCLAGYFLEVKPRLVRSGFVQFDRYFHDVMVDPRRYRYGGPQWYAKLLSRLLPEPDLVIVLDANEDLILSRKTELTRAEIQRQRQAYAELRFRRAKEVCVRTDGGIQPTLKASATAVAEFMSQRFDKRIGNWMRVA
jgi:thymidylate kinase